MKVYKGMNKNKVTVFFAIVFSIGLVGAALAASAQFDGTATAKDMFLNMLIDDADVVVDGKVIVEVKAVDKLKGLFEAQLLNYLKASGMDVGLIINFGPSVTVKRMVR